MTQHAMAERRAAGGALGALWTACAAVSAPPPATTVPPTRTPAPLAAPEAPYRVLSRARVVATGDVLMHGAVKESAAAVDRREGDRSTNFGGYAALFEGVATELARADVALANLETPVMPAAGIAPRPFVFSAPPEVLGALRAAGVDVVSLANNHVYDQGRPGLEASLAEVARSGLAALGAGASRQTAERPVVVEANGVRLAFLAYTQFFNDPLNLPDQPEAAWANPIDPDRMVEAVEAARRQADFVIVSCHWGVEYATAPRASEIDLAHRLIDAGADAVLGHHPHVLQPIEIWRAPDGRSGLIAYSLGNFISNQSRLYDHAVTPERVAETRDGVVLAFAAEKRDYGAGVVRTELAEVRYWPLWTDNDTLDRRGQGPPTIRVAVIDRALAAANAELSALLVARPASGFTTEQAEAYARLKRRLDLLLRRKAEIARRVGEDFLAEE